jgi:hypothetical protein
MAVSVAVDGVLTAELADVDGAGLDAALLARGVVAGEPDDDFDDEHAVETLTTAAAISTVTTCTARRMNPPTASGTAIPRYIKPESPDHRTR